MSGCWLKEICRDTATIPHHVNVSFITDSVWLIWLPDVRASPAWLGPGKWGDKQGSGRSSGVETAGPGLGPEALPQASVPPSSFRPFSSHYERAASAWMSFCPFRNLIAHGFAAFNLDFLCAHIYAHGLFFREVSILPSDSSGKQWLPPIPPLHQRSKNHCCSISVPSRFSFYWELSQSFSFLIPNSQ